MKVLVVGATGFIAKNLIASLENIISGKDRTYDFSGDIVLYKYSRNMGMEKLKEYCKDCNFVFYLAGVNRPKIPEEFLLGNVEYLECILKELCYQRNACPVMYASSIQASLDNAYGKSKKMGEEIIKKYGYESGATVYIYRLTNIFHLYGWKCV